jgi:nickel-dependent lactate racemase
MRPECSDGGVTSERVEERSSMKVTLKYGTDGLPVDLPSTPGFVGVLGPSEPEPLKEPAAVLEQALLGPIASAPLASIAKGKTSACIVISDITRPVPNPLLLPPILRTLEAEGIRRSDILILIATGMHRESTDEERERLVGPEIARNYRVDDHRSRSRDEMVEVGKIGRTAPALVNRRYVEADLKILTGFIEPHLYAGYSGGRKAILPGISSIDTLQYMHGPEMVSRVADRLGRLEANAFHEAGLEIMRLAGADFLVNVTLDNAKRVTGIFAGDPVEAHLAGCRFLALYCMKQVDAPLDFVVTTNAGAPLDFTFYQTIKGIAGGAGALKKGGDILVASRCMEGFGGDEFCQVLNMVTSPQEFLDRLLRKEFFLPDQWCAQSMYTILLERGIWVHSDGLPEEDLRRFHFHPVSSVEEGVAALLEKHGPNARWAVIPEGPMLILEVAREGQDT